MSCATRNPGALNECGANDPPVNIGSDEKTLGFKKKFAGVEFY